MSPLQKRLRPRGAEIGGQPLASLVNNAGIQHICSTGDTEGLRLESDPCIRGDDDLSGSHADWTNRVRYGSCRSGLNHALFGTRSQCRPTPLPQRSRTRSVKPTWT